MIQLHGLTKRQVKIAEKLWECDSQDDVIKYLSTLSRKDQFDARSIIICMLHEAIEVDKAGASYAASVFNELMKRL
jgi:hypothetical protein